MKRVHPSQSPLICASSIFSHDGPPSVPTTCMLPVVKREESIEKHCGADTKNVGGLPQAVCIHLRLEFFLF